jgi:hypothetical protein
VGDDVQVVVSGEVSGCKKFIKSIKINKNKTKNTQVGGVFFVFM